jgi:hypothetical protein
LGRLTVLATGTPRRATRREVGGVLRPAAEGFFLRTALAEAFLVRFMPVAVLFDRL